MKDPLASSKSDSISHHPAVGKYSSRGANTNMSTRNKRLGWLSFLANHTSSRRLLRDVLCDVPLATLVLGWLLVLFPLSTA